MMRIGVDGRELAGGVRSGIGRYLVEVLRAAARDGLECLVYGDGRTALPVTLPGVSLRRLDAGPTLWVDQVGLPRCLARDRIAVFLSPYYKGPVWAPCPVVVTVHDLMFIGYPGSRRPLYDLVMTGLARVYAGRASTVITDSEYSKRSIVTTLGVSDAKVTVIPVALGAEFKPEPLADAVMVRYGIVPPYVLYVGNFLPHKNVPRLIEAYSGLGRELTDTHQLVLAGGKREHRNDLERLAVRLSVAGRVLFPGLIDDAHLPAVYGGAALFVLPSLEEGFGLPVAEAMACGAPVAASNRAAIPEVAGDAALLFDPENVSAIAEAMTRVLSQPELSARMRRQGLARAGAFTLERTAGRVVALLREVATGR
ncbi:MAG: glycosyltransferase family 1 protein [Nitrospirae bacterium]|nr:MAG: glycosyltransferase family 1 protein [Nitrospirota bacterium]